MGQKEIEHPYIRNQECPFCENPNNYRDFCKGGFSLSIDLSGRSLFCGIRKPHFHEKCQSCHAMWTRATYEQGKVMDAVLGDEDVVTLERGGDDSVSADIESGARALIALNKAMSTYAKKK